MKVNTKNKDPKKWKTREYIVSYCFTWNKHYYEGVKPTIKELLEYIETFKPKSVELLAHNGEGFDFKLIRRSLIDNYGLTPLNMFVRNSVSHDLETNTKELKGNYMLESHVKSKTRLGLKFRLNNIKYECVDTLPKFHMSIKTLGSILKDLGIGEKGKNVKLDYSDNYEKFDKEEDMTTSELVKYCKDIYNSLNQHAKDYVLNDTRVMYTGFINYNKIFDSSYDNSKRTLSLNVLHQYEVNDLATFQLLNSYDKNKIELSAYAFKTGSNHGSLYEYVKRFYHGGLNIYNDKYNATVVHDLVHIDINSSYPSIMRYKEFPTYLIKASVENELLKFNDKYYYFFEVSKQTFKKLLLANIKSSMIRKALIKYLDPVTNNTESIFLQTPHLKLIEKFMKKSVTELPVISYLQFEKHHFGGLPVIQTNYKAKTDAKKRGASNGEVQAFKVPLNSIYGVSALRAYFPLYEYDENFNLISINNGLGFKNKERNLIFSSSVTAYAFEKLLTPLTHNIKDIDESFIYADTDSLFLRLDYWNKIKKYVHCDPVELGAWNLEHKHIRDFYSLNHKKYCLWSYDKNKIEVYSGGIPKSTFNLNVSFNDFIKDQFHDGSKLRTLRNCENEEGCTILYDGITEIKKGLNYPDIKDFATPETELEKHMIMLTIQNKELNDPTGNGALYYETELGTVSPSDAFPYHNSLDKDTKINIKYLLRYYNMFRDKIETMYIDQQGKKKMEL